MFNRIKAFSLLGENDKKIVLSTSDYLAYVQTILTQLNAQAVVAM